VFSPDGDGSRDRITSSYEINERARAMMLIDGQRRVLAKFPSREGKLVWFGRIDGRPVRPAVYEVRLRAVDRAGNRSARTRAVPVRVRMSALARSHRVVAGKRFSVRYATRRRIGGSSPGRGGPERVRA
jgi:hypothetical protein